MLNLKRGETYVIKVPHLPGNNVDDQIKVIFEGEINCERGIMKMFRSKAGGYTITYTSEQWLRCECRTKDGVEIEKKLSDEMVSIKTACSLFGYTRQVVSRLCNSGDVVGAEMIDNKWMLPLSSASKIKLKPSGASARRSANESN